MSKIPEVYTHEVWSLMDLDKTLFSCIWAVEATDCERMGIWDTWFKDGVFKGNKQITYYHKPAGWAKKIGEVKIGKEKFPICVTFSFIEINGHLVVFYDPCSMVVHHGMVDAWIRKKGLSVTNAMNFHHVIHDIWDREEKARRAKNEEVKELLRTMPIDGSWEKV